MKALVLSLLLLAILSTQLPSPAMAQTTCTLSSCTAIVNRSIVTSNWGVTFVSDQFTLSLGSSPVSQIALGIPSTLSSKLRFTEAVDSQSNQLRISPPSTSTLPSGGNYSAIDIAFPSAKTGGYSFNLTSVYSDLLNFNATSSSFTFAFEPFPLTDGTYNVTSAQLSVKTGDWPSPKVSSVNGAFASATFTAQTTTLKPYNTTVATMTFTTSGNQILVAVSTVTPMSSLSFTMDYQLDPFWASLSALGWAGLAVGSIAAVVLAIGATSTAGVTISGAPSELIGRFVELYDEKSAMRLEAEKMDEDLARGALNRHEFKRRRRVIDLRIAELDRTLAPVKDQLSKSNPRYQDMIKRLERAEADIQVVRTTSADLRNQYRSGRIARELYESLISDLAKRKEKAQQTMDTIVINLREETR